MSALAEYAEKLNSCDEAERIYAAEDIGYLNVPEGVAPLLQRLDREGSRTVREMIFQALLRIDADVAIEASVRLLESEDPQVRNQAVEVLRHKGGRAIPFLQAVMRDGDKDLRKLVLDVLSGIRAAGSEAIYAAALGDQDQNIVITAVENLGGVRAEEYRSPIEDLLQPGSHPMLIAACMEALAGIGNDDSLAAIRRCFPDFAAMPDFLLAPCLKSIAALGSGAEFAQVSDLLRLRRPHLRSAILGALLTMYPRCRVPDPGQDLLAALRQVIEDGDPTLCRYQAVRVLGIWAARDDIHELLVSYLCSSERLIRLGAAESLRLSGRPESAAILAGTISQETDEEVLQVLHC
jgi:HEAT repeat protein